MRINKNIILVISVIIFFVVVTYFTDADESNISPDNTNNADNLEMENEKLKQDIMYLKQEIESLKKSSLKAEKFIFESELASDYLSNYRGFPESEILYKKIEDSKYTLLFKDKIETYIVVALDEPRYDIFLTIPTLNPNNGITMDFSSNSKHQYFGGIITDKEIKNVKVIQDTKVHKASIFKMEDGIYVWYSILENDSGVSRDRPDNVSIQALDDNDVTLWEKSY